MPKLSWACIRLVCLPPGRRNTLRATEIVYRREEFRSRPLLSSVSTQMIPSRVLIRPSLMIPSKILIRPSLNFTIANLTIFRRTSLAYPLRSRRRCLHHPLPPRRSTHLRPLSTSTATSTPDTPMCPPDDDITEDTVEELLVEPSRVWRLMKMARKPEPAAGGGNQRWFPYLDSFPTAWGPLTSRDVLDVLDEFILGPRKEKLMKAVGGRSYSLSLVVEGLTDVGNVSAAFRSADALGVQSVHVISRDPNKRYRQNRHVSRGSEKWLDIELWNSPLECFKVLKSRGYLIATAHLSPESVSVYEMDWSKPTAIVVGNEHMGITADALQLSDLHCCIPMKGMVDSFNVSVAAGILMHHAVSNRVSRLGYHGDLSFAESQILLAEFFLRHKVSTTGILEEHARKKWRLAT